MVKYMKKNKSKNFKEFDEFGKELITLLPMNHMQKLFKQLENFDGETPETLLTKIKNKPLSFPRISDEKQKSFQDKFLSTIRNPKYALLIKAQCEENIKFIKTDLKKDSRYSLLINLTNKADKNIELVSLPFLRPFMDFERNFILFCKPINLLEKINKSVGEKRKNFLVELFREIPEPLYKNYSETVWRLSYLAELKMFPKETPKFGELVNQSMNRLRDFPCLVEGKMKLLRNSFAHNNFEYNLEDDSFVVWDDNTPKTNIAADEILKIAKDVTFMCVETFPLFCQLYLMQNFLIDSGFLETYLENISALTSGNPLEVSKAEKELSDFGEILTEPMRNFFQKHQRV